MDTTEECLARALAGDTEARGELLARHVARLHAFVRPRLGAALRAHESSQDVVQSVLREAWAGFDGFRPRWSEDGVHGARSHFRRWVLTVADRKLKSRGRFWSRLRRSSKRELRVEPEALAEFEGVDTHSPSTAANSREELSRIERAFRELPPTWREIVVLVRFEGLSHAEAARRLGRTESATRTLLSRALARLATGLERNGGGR